LLCSLLLLGVTIGARAAEAERPRRVLMVHSFGSSAPPFTTHSTAFESTIKRELGTAVDLDEVSLDMARYAQPDMEEAFAEFLVKRCRSGSRTWWCRSGRRRAGSWRNSGTGSSPDAGGLHGMDRRTLPADAFAKNATFVGESFDLAGVVEDMLALDPETSHVVVILGATPLSVTGRRSFKRRSSRSPDGSGSRGRTTCHSSRCSTWSQSFRRTRSSCWGC
jgi:hypothetical protein